jgi:hypothetical protein
MLMFLVFFFFFSFLFFLFIFLLFALKDCSDRRILTLAIATKFWQNISKSGIGLLDNPAILCQIPAILAGIWSLPLNPGQTG